MAVTNDEEFRAWLKEQPQEVCAAIAYRAAMRVLPIAALAAGSDDGSLRLALATFRIILSSGVAAAAPTSDVRSATRSAADAATDAVANPARAASRASAYAAAHAAARAAAYAAAYQAADAPIFAARAAARAADAVDDASARTATYAAASADTELEASGIMGSVIGVPIELRNALASFATGRIDLLHADGPWSFWAHWYDRAMAGDPLPWDLQEKVALIPNDVWEAGPEAVAEEIDRLSFQFATSVAPRLVRDEKADVFRVEADPLPPDELAAFACQRAEMALTVALASVSDNVFNERSYEAITLRNTLAGERTISLLAVGFFDACLGLNRNIGDRYPNEVALVNLQNALAGIVDELCALDEMARARCARLAGYNPERAVQDLDPAELARIADLVALELDAKARAIVESDVERLLSEEATLPKWRRMRLTNWLTTISIYWDRTKKGYKEAKALSDMVTKLREWGRGAWDFWSGGGA